MILRDLKISNNNAIKLLSRGLVSRKEICSEQDDEYFYMRYIHYNYAIRINALCDAIVIIDNEEIPIGINDTDKLKYVYSEDYNKQEDIEEDDEEYDYDCPDCKFDFLDDETNDNDTVSDNMNGSEQEPAANIYQYDRMVETTKTEDEINDIAEVEDSDYSNESNDT